MITTTDGRVYSYGTTLQSSHVSGYASGAISVGPRKAVWMLERVTAYGGDFAAGPTADGWRVRASLPLAVEDDLLEEPRSR